MASTQFSMRRLVRIKIILVALASTLFGVDGVVSLAQEQAPVPGFFLSETVTPHVFNNDLRTLPTAVPPRPGTLASDMPAGVLPGAPESVGGDMGSGDGAVAPRVPMGAAVTPREFSTPIPNFLGIGYTGLVPPDPVGDVGPDHYIQMVNSQFQIFDKQGNSLAGPFNINSLWQNANVGTLCNANNNGDPYVLYDHLADRWVLSQFAVPNGFANPPTAQCIAVSITADPVTGGWYLYEFVFNFAHDYPKMGVWQDGYYMSSQQGFSGGNLNAVVFDRANMLNGNPATFQAFTSGPPALIWLPSDLDGPPPPAGTPNFFGRHVDGNQWGGADRVDIMAFSVNWQNPALSTFVALPSLAAAPFDSNLCFAGNLFDNCVPQPNTTTRLETLPHWAMGPLQYRNFGTHETLVFNHTVDVDGNGHAGIRWYELHRLPGGAWFVFQQGTHSPDAGNAGLADDVHRWMGSIAMDKAGNLALGYSVSSATVFPSISYVGRLADDPLGLMPHGAPPDGEFSLVVGGNSQIINGTRWGDYSAMRVDPVDECTFWYTQQYILAGEPFGPGNGGAWGTRIGAFRFPSCNPADLAIFKTADQVVVEPGKDLFYTITVSNNGPDNATDVVVTDTLPKGVTFVVATDACVEKPRRTLTCRLGDLDAGKTVTFIIKVVVDAHIKDTITITNSATVTAAQQDPDPNNNTTKVTTIVEKEKRRR